MLNTQLEIEADQSEIEVKSNLEDLFMIQKKLKDEKREIRNWEKEAKTEQLKRLEEAKKGLLEQIKAEKESIFENLNENEAYKESFIASLKLSIEEKEAKAKLKESLAKIKDGEQLAFFETTVGNDYVKMSAQKTHEICINGKIIK